MFEEGERLKQVHGTDKVYDYSLGNPINEPPNSFVQQMYELASNPLPGMHRYMPNSGYLETRQAVADVVSEISGKRVEARHVIMTVGASGAANVVLKSILDPGDEVIILAPYFVEYKFYIGNHGGQPVVADTREDFQPDIDKIAAAMSPKTKAIIINSPNNPTGVIYNAERLDRLNDLVEAKSEEYGHDIYVISDEPYAKITFDGNKVPPVFKHIRNSIIVTSHSKDLALPGERIGYLVANPDISDVDMLMEACAFSIRILGFVNAPALMQRLITRLQREPADVAQYQEKRDLLYDNLTSFGFEMVKPQGAFYLFPKSPLADDVEFVNKAREKNILVVPGTGFGKPGYFRIAFCVEKQMIERSLPAFGVLAKECGLKGK